jgi:hypothetical protein
LGPPITQLRIGLFCCTRSDDPSSDPVASRPDEKKEGRDHGDQDKHPVLALETENRKMLTRNCTAPAPAFGAFCLCGIGGSVAQIYYFYMDRAACALIQPARIFSNRDCSR